MKDKNLGYYFVLLILAIFTGGILLGYFAGKYESRQKLDTDIKHFDRASTLMYGQNVLLINLESIFFGCHGKVKEERVETDHTYYVVELEECPLEKAPYLNVLVREDHLKGER